MSNLLKLETMILIPKRGVFNPEKNFVVGKAGIAYFSPGFVGLMEHIGNEPSEEAHILHCSVLLKRLVNKSIINDIGRDKAGISLATLFYLIENNKLSKNCWNVFYILRNGKIVRTVLAVWGVDGWDLRLFSVNSTSPWFAGNCVFYRSLVENLNI